MGWRHSWKANIFWIVLLTVTVYASTAWAGQLIADSGRAGCERQNILRKAVYENAEGRAAYGLAIQRAVQAGPNAEAVRKAAAADVASAEKNVEELTVSGHLRPWEIDCGTAYPPPLPWP